jgi:mannose-6-phosphate isomerase
VTEPLKRVEKPWGYELWWAVTDKYVGKIFVWSGKILFERQEGEQLVARELVKGDAVHVTPPTVHRMTALEDSDIFEVSTAETDDVVRLEDRYGRQGT